MAKLRFVLLLLVCVFSYILYKGVTENPDNHSIKEQKLERFNTSYDFIDIDTSLKRLPDVLILGVKKCGTQTLGTILSMHPNIVISKPIEVKFFAEDMKYKKGLEYYRSKMPRASEEQLILSKSPNVFQNPNIREVLQRERRTLPNVKVILVVKNPIVRVVSDIVHTYVGGTQAEKKMPEINDIIMGRAGYIKAYEYSDASLSETIFTLSNYSMMYDLMEQVFPKENILIVNGETMITDPLKEIKMVESFLKLPPFFSRTHFIYPEEKKGFPCFKIGEDYHQCMGKNKGRKHPDLSGKTMKYLKKKFQPMVDAFSKQTGIVFQL